MRVMPRVMRVLLQPPPRLPILLRPPPLLLLKMLLMLMRLLAIQPACERPNLGTYGVAAAADMLLLLMPAPRLSEPQLPLMRPPLAAVAVVGMAGVLRAWLCACVLS